MRRTDDSETEPIFSGKYESKQPDPFIPLVVILTLATVGYLLYSIFRSVGAIDLSGVRTFNTVFTSILMQAFPFMLIGVLVSSALHVFVPDEFIIKIFPEKYGLGFITAMFAGIFFPICECAIVPVMTRLVKKGVPVSVAVTFMLSAPIINPIVIVSTLYAFSGRPEIALMRVCFGLVIALAVGLILRFFFKTDTVLLPEDEADGDTCRHGHDCSCCAPNGDIIKKSTPEKFGDMFLHAGDEFFSVGKYIVIGAFMASLIQELVPEDVFLSLSSQNGVSLFLMMAMAFLFSACSTSDAFIARSFMNQVPMGAIMGFLVFGPMMDIKNLLMLFAGFKKTFVLKLSLLIFVLNFIMLYFLAFLFL